MIKRSILCIALLFAICIALEVPALGQVGEPVTGCLQADGAFYQILGIPGSFVARPVDRCEQPANPWRVRGEGDDPGELWLEKVDGETLAIEHREKLEAGNYGVFSDGTVVSFDKAGLPGQAGEWQLASPEWLAVRAGAAWVMVSKRGEWVYLPLPEAAQ
jgi:hypothetical protein